MEAGGLVTRGRPRRSGAFTLLELLVSIAVLAILIGMLAPALAQVTGVTGPLMRCGRNLHSLHQAMTMYVNDNRGILPNGQYYPIWEPDADSLQRYAPRLDETLAPYGGEMKELWLCPADRSNPALTRDVNLMASSYIYPASRMMSSARLQYDMLASKFLEMPLLADMRAFHRMGQDDTAAVLEASFILDRNRGEAFVNWARRYPTGHNRVRMDGSITATVNRPTANSDQ